MHLSLVLLSFNTILISTVCGNRSAPKREPCKPDPDKDGVVILTPECEHRVILPDDFSDEHNREVRQLNLGSLLKPLTNQGTQKNIACQTPQGEKGRCLPIEQCVLKELDNDYIKNKGYLCALGTNGPVGVCCRNSITKPVAYREGMFGQKTWPREQTGKSGAETADGETTPEDA